jgi:hypothetical protein
MRCGIERIEMACENFRALIPCREPKSKHNLNNHGESIKERLKRLRE